MITTNKPQIPITGKETVEQLMLIQQVNQMNIKKIDLINSSSNNVFDETILGKTIYLIFQTFLNVDDNSVDVDRKFTTMKLIDNSVLSLYSEIPFFDTGTNDVKFDTQPKYLKNLLFKEIGGGFGFIFSNTIGYKITLN